MNSLTGTGANVGAQTGKIVACATRNKRCATCSTAKREKRLPKSYDCCPNHAASLKAMEPAVAVDLAKKLEEDKVRVACLVGDGDSPTTKGLNNEYGNVDKHSDIICAKRSLGSKLRDIKSALTDCKQLTSVIQYAEKMFSYALQNNKDNVDSL